MSQKTIEKSSSTNPQAAVLKPPCVGDVMTTEVVNLSPRHNFADAVNLIANRHFHHFLVVEDERLVGIVSDRDILRGLARTDNWQRKEVGQFMTIEPMTVQPSTALTVAIAKMLAKRINCLPVTDSNGKIYGILTSTDVLKSYHSALESFEK